MKSLTSFCLTAIAAATGWLGPLSSSSPNLNAATVLAVDLGAGAAQTGFTGWSFADTANDPPLGPRSRTFTSIGTIYAPTGAITATVAGGTSINMAENLGSMNFRTRSSPSPVPGEFTYQNLFNDRLVTLSSGANAGLFLELTGLVAGATYTLQVWGVDTNIVPTGGGAGGAKPGNFELFNYTSGTAVSMGGYSTTSGQLPTTNDSFSVTGTVVADANGRILVQSRSNMDGGGILNGFVLSSNIVPEPGRSLLLVGALGWISLLRRR